MDSGILLVIVTALGFGAWPLIARASGANEAWVAIMVMIVTTIVAGGAQLSKLPGIPGWKTLSLLALAGAANGIGMITYSKLVSGRGFEISGLAPMSVILMIVVIAVGGVIFFQESFTWQKGLGLTLAAAGAWLLS